MVYPRSFTDDDVREIRARWANRRPCCPSCGQEIKGGRVLLKMLAADYGVSVSTVWRVLSGKSYGSVQNRALDRVSTQRGAGAGLISGGNQ